MHISARRGRIAAWIALPLAVVASGTVIGTASYAAFSATTDNAGNTWRTGALALVDDDMGAALFDVDELVPGDSGSNVITVTATTSKNATVHLYTADDQDLDGLGEHLTMTVERGSLTTAGDDASFTPDRTVYEGDLAGLSASDSFADGVDDWKPSAGTDTASYRFSYRLSMDAPNSVQDSLASTTFVWESQTD